MAVNYTDTPPRGFDMMSTLIELLAEQEGLKITYELTDGKTTIKKSTDRKEEAKWGKAS